MQDGAPSRSARTRWRMLAHVGDVEGRYVLRTKNLSGVYLFFESWNTNDSLRRDCSKQVGV